MTTERLDISPDYYGGYYPEAGRFIEQKRPGFAVLFWGSVIGTPLGLLVCYLAYHGMDAKAQMPVYERPLYKQHPAFLSESEEQDSSSPDAMPVSEMKLEAKVDPLKTGKNSQQLPKTKGVVAEVPETTSSSTSRFVSETRKVKEGETLEGIAREHRFSWRDLCRMNRLENCHRIKVGQVLTIPSKDESPKTDSDRVAVYKDRAESQSSPKKRSVPAVIPNIGKRVNPKLASVAENFNAYPLVNPKNWYAKKVLSLTKSQWGKLLAAGLTVKQIDAVDENLRNGLCKGALRHEGHSWTFFASGKGVFRDTSRNVLETGEDVWQCPETQGVQVDILMRSGNLAGSTWSSTGLSRGEKDTR